MNTIDSWATLLRLRQSEFEGLKHNTIQEKYVLLLASRISELCYDVVLLLNQKRISAAPIILRTALESYADLLSCIKDASYYEKMTKSLYWQLYEVSKGIDQEKSDYYKSIGKYLPPNKRFTAAGLKELFDGYYKRLSLDCHGNLSALIELHSKDNNVYLYAINDKEKNEIFFRHATNLMANCLKEKWLFFGRSENAVIEVQKIIDSINGGNR